MIKEDEEYWRKKENNGEGQVRTGREDLLVFIKDLLEGLVEKWEGLDC